MQQKCFLALSVGDVCRDDQVSKSGDVVLKLNFRRPCLGSMFGSKGGNVADCHC